jgi:hypothetical protein
MMLQALMGLLAFIAVMLACLNPVQAAPIDCQSLLTGEAVQVDWGDFAPTKSIELNETEQEEIMRLIDQAAE